MNDVQKRIKQEKATIETMIRLYCKGNHGKELCDDCNKIRDYAFMRIDYCPFMETKTFCSSCKVHCYKKDMREKIKVVMRYAGPRMLFTNPILVTKHLFEEIKRRREE